jgi:ABC-type dipeptide/oligopeptide/nickel transport system permease subunit
MPSDAVSNRDCLIDPTYMIIPGLAIVITMMAFNVRRRRA